MTLLAGYRQTCGLVSTNRGSWGEGQRVLAHTHTHCTLSISNPMLVNNVPCASGRFPSGSVLKLSVKYAGIHLVEHSCSYLFDLTINANADNTMRCWHLRGLILHSCCVSIVHSYFFFLSFSDQTQESWKHDTQPVVQHVDHSINKRVNANHANWKMKPFEHVRNVW